MNQNRDSPSNNSFELSKSTTAQRAVRPRNPILDIARIGAFSALVAVGTILSNVLFGFTLPPPLGEITAAPAFYLALEFLFYRKVRFWSPAFAYVFVQTINNFVFVLPRP